MAVEMPIIAAVMSRMADAEVNLAALGGVVFPLALVIESPIIMMLAASTALATDAASCRVLERFMVRLAVALTLLHVVVAFTPLFDVLAGTVIGAPAEIIEPARTGLRLMTPWTWAIADRRFHQGILIRLGHQRQIGIGTVVRLVAVCAALGAGIVTGWFPSVAVAGAAFSVSAVVEMLYIRWCIGAVGARRVLAARPPGAPLTTGRLWRFYVPLALTPLLALLTQPIGSAGISRMHDALPSLAVWPVLNGLAFMLRSGGVAYNEVVVRHCGDRDGPRVLGRMAWRLGIVWSLVLVVVAATPLSTWWFADLCGLDAYLAALGRAALWWASLFPVLSYLHSYYQGVLVHAQRTRGITEAVGVFLLVTAAVLAAGVAVSPWSGATTAMIALSAGAAAQTGWLRMRCRGRLA
jgi:hypothetical protein